MISRFGFLASLKHRRHWFSFVSRFSASVKAGMSLKNLNAMILTVAH